MASLCWAALATSGEAQYASLPYKVAHPGQRIRLGYYYSLTPNCQSQGSVELKILLAPGHGELGTGGGRDYPNFPTTNTHSSCNRGKVSVTYLYYTAVSDFSGVDAVRVAVLFPSATARQYTYVIAVR